MTTFTNTDKAQSDMKANPMNSEHQSIQDDDSLVFAMDMATGESVPMPGAPDAGLLEDLLRDARSTHTVLLARESNIMERQYKLSQLWLAAVALCTAAGLWGDARADLWMALGFAVGFGVSVLLMGLQQATLPGYAVGDFIDPYAMASPEHTRQVLLSTWAEVIRRSESALTLRLKRYSAGVWLLAAYMPASILARLLV